MTCKDLEPAIHADAADSDLLEPSANWNDLGIVCNADASDHQRQGA
jgi:hypothetical protein